MRLPDWLQELRDLLALTSYEGRQQAMQQWEARWLIDLHQVKLITEVALHTARFNLLQHASDAVLHDLGKTLVGMMADLTIQERPDMGDGLQHVMEVRADAMAIRREPQDAE